MTEAQIKEDHEIEKASNEDEGIQSVEDEIIQNEDSNRDFNPNASFLTELNLLVLICSLYSSDEDSLSLEGNEKKGMEDHESKSCVSNTCHSRSRRGSNEAKHTIRRTPKFQTTTKDFGHCRKM